jgi:peptidoglycan hydrolase-like amidase
MQKQKFLKFSRNGTNGVFYMKEQLPLKRMGLGLLSTLIAILTITVADVANGDTSKNMAETKVIYNEGQYYHTGAYASVTEVNHNEYEVTSWWKANIFDYNEKLALESIQTTIETTTPPITETVTEATTQVTTVATIETAAVPVNNQPPVNANEATMLQPPPQREVAVPDMQQAGMFYFTSYGYGHGVGLSQNGANHYATYAGYDYIQILQHYYPGTELVYNQNVATETITVSGVSGSALDVISQVCNAEVGSSFNPEAIKAQAVAAYTYVKYLGGKTNGMAVKPYPDQKIIDAVNAVLGQTVYYQGKYALTQFSASSGGATASNKDVNWEDLPYLRSVPCEYDQNCDPNYGYSKAITSSDLKAILERKYGLTLSADYSNWIQVVEGDGGYIKTVIIDNQKEVKGYQFAVSIGLKSGNFDFLYS